MRHRIVLVGVMVLVGVVVASAFLGPLLVGITGTARPPHVSLQGQSAVPEGLTRLRFEENQGQAGLDARFVLRLPGAGVAFEASGPRLYFGGTGSLRMRFAGGADAPRLDGLHRLPGVTNYLIGSNPADWQIGLASFGRVRYHEVYPGIDVVFHGDQGPLEYDLVARPGADPRAVRLAFDGAGSVSIDSTGRLLIDGPGGLLTQQPPTAYQLIDGQRHEVDSRFATDAAGRVSFELGSYDPTLPLVIDPVIGYSTFLGGEHSDIANAIAVDSAGSTYVTGETDSTMFPLRNPFDPTIGGGTCGFGFPCRDAFVAKLNPAGTKLVYATYLGGNSDDMGRGIAVDPSGNAYVTGNTASANFPTQNPIQATFGGGTCSEIGCIGDAFVTKLGPTGTSLVYSTYLGGAGNDQGNGIAVGADGQAAVAGITQSGNFPTRKAFQPSIAGVRDGFVAKLAAAGSSFQYSTYLGGHETGFDLVESARAVALDAQGSAYVTGETTAPDFPLKNPFQGVCVGCDSARSDAFVAKLQPTGRALVYSTYLGGFTDEGSMGHEQGLGVAVGPGNEAFVAGFTSSRDFPVTPGAFQETFGEGDDGVGGDGFVTRFSAAGGTLRYSTYLGGQHNDVAQAVAVDSGGHAHVTGYTNSDDFPIRLPLQSELLGQYDAFVSTLNPKGSRLQDSTFLGGSQGDVIQVTFGTGIAVDASRNAYVVGWTDTTDFPVQNAFQPNLRGEYDSFVTKIAPG
jgi:hypothetical protein